MEDINNVMEVKVVENTICKIALNDGKVTRVNTLSSQGNNFLNFLSNSSTFNFVNLLYI